MFDTKVNTNYAAYLHHMKKIFLRLTLIANCEKRKVKNRSRAKHLRLTLKLRIFNLTMNFSQSLLLLLIPFFPLNIREQ